MSRQRANRRRTARPRAAVPPGRRSHRARGAWRAAGLAAVVVFVALVIATLRPWDRLVGRGTPAAGVADSIARLGPDEAFQRGMVLLRSKRAWESLPFLRHAAGFPGSPQELHMACSDGLQIAALQERRVSGLPMPATRSTFERVALMRESLSELDIAERQARTATALALAHAARAHHYVTWGMPWEALAEFRQAQALDPGAWAGLADALATRLHHPERPDPPGLSPEAAGQGP